MPEPGLPGDPFVVALFGPTGVGKTGVAIELGELMRDGGASVAAVNCDSMQVYSGLEVISGAPTPTERQRLEHLLVSHVSIDATYSSALFARDAHRAIDRLLEEGRWPLVVGGTGLYLRAALSDLDMLPTVPEDVMTELEGDWEELGPARMHERLPENLRSAVHPNDRKRILRFLGLVRVGVEPHPDTSKGGELWSSELRHPTLLVGMTAQKEELEARIRKRVLSMAEAGAVEEAARASEASISMTASKAIGFRDFLAGDIDAVVQRQIALVRRQMTWMNRMEGVVEIERRDQTEREIAREILGLLQYGSEQNASRQWPG